ncbi:GNAT family N-acetyltransferase [Nocardioides sp. J2M5]|uniref:GNAT family N-acetyltransferase n=1 Tax=Nocardioides palaemonis TaxID=2829810 RepID=UPI001BA8B49C|nr:GNAT family N-acetyltransferase [Nocardioides palaemonis]MBS2936895.1 GNAT family N-acetyltransferase [Nocardioides palaemonis]
MDDTPEPQPVGRHSLGPHVVGRRVVVRHLLPDGRASDVLGTCTAWDWETLTVDRDGHGPVAIPLADVVTGKPVPPRASVRSRVPASEVERHVEALWAEVTTEPLGAWTLRASPPHGGRLRRRGNSVLAMEDPGIGWADAVWRVREFYAARDQAPLAQVRLGSDEEERLATLGFAPTGSGDAHAQLAPVAQLARATRGVTTDLPSRTDESPAEATVVLADGVARGRGVLSGDWLLVEGLEVDPDHQRRGLATYVLGELVDWGASRGARTAMLHVEVANDGALALYDRLGFRTHHTNRYLVLTSG